MANSDNFIFLGPNYFRLDGGKISDSGTLTNYYAEDAFDARADTYWYSSSTSTSDSLYIDCGATLAESANRLFVDGNVSDFTLYWSSDQSVWTSALDVTGATASYLHTLSDTQAVRYWRFLASGTSSASQYRQIKRLGLYTYQYQFSDSRNPFFTPELLEAGQEGMTWDNLAWTPKLREAAALSLEIEQLADAGYATLLSIFRNYRNFMAIYPQPRTFPAELYDVKLAGSYALKYRTKNPSLGRSGTLSFRSA